MSALAIRRRLHRLRGSLVAAACVLALGGAVAAHHAGMPAGHGGMDMHGVATMVMCLGVLGLAAVAVAGLPKLGRLLSRRPRARSERVPELALPRGGVYPARAGPPLFLRLVVLRR